MKSSITIDELPPDVFGNNFLIPNSPEVLEHPNYVIAMRRLSACLLMRDAGQIIVLSGPTRIGKSFLTEAIEAANPPAENYSDAVLPLRPIVRIKAINYSDGSFIDFRQFWKCALLEIKHPFLDEAVMLNGKVLDPKRTSTDEYILMFQHALKVMQTKYLFIDEAQHFARAKGGKEGAARFFDMLKLFAEESGCVLILAGAFPILDVLKDEAQIQSRARHIFMGLSGSRNDFQA